MIKTSNCFPFQTIRSGQLEFMKDIEKALTNKKHLIAHVPTGIGKTVAVLSSTLPYALGNSKTILYLVPKQSQHKIVVETLQAISNHTGTSINTVDIINKQSMCLQEDMRSLFFADFLHRCFNFRKTKSCKFWGTQKFLDGIYGIVDVEDLIEFGKENSACPYYAGMERLQTADVVVGDYNLIFSDMLEYTLEQLHKSLDELVIIVDEAHNLPSRAIDHMSGRLTAHKLDAAAAEIRKDNYECSQLLSSLQTTLKSYLKKETEYMNVDSKKLVDKEEFVSLTEEVLSERFATKAYDIFCEELEQHLYNHYSCEVAKFLDGWMNLGESIHMIVRKEKTSYITFKCLDPAVLTKGIVDECRDVIAMSGTLYPMDMYRDILGFPDDTITRSYNSPYPKHNKLNIITHELTSEYTQRTELMFMRIAKAISDIAVGNTLVFFPSYTLLNEVRQQLPTQTSNRVIVEQQGMSKEEKQGLYNFIVDYGAILFGVQGGSLSEGFDYKDNVISTVIVVGLPLAPPDVDVTAQIEYYSGKFGKQLGRKYAYVYPCVRKAIQAAGRGIRSETDRCAIVYMDYRYNWNTYKVCFDEDVKYMSMSHALLELKKFNKRM